MNTAHRYILIRRAVAIVRSGVPIDPRILARLARTYGLPEERMYTILVEYINGVVCK